MSNAPATSDTNPRVGRPSTYSPELARRICQRLGNSTTSLRALCQQPGMPGRATIYRWLEEHPEFHEMYNIAREEQLDFLVEEMLQIADDASNDWMKDEKGKLVLNRQAIARTKIRLSTRQWLITHLQPKKYHSRQEDQYQPQVRRHLTLEEFEERMKLATA